MSIAPSRVRLVERIHACVALGRSNHPHEAALAIERARDLCARYDVRVDELSPAAAAELAPHDVAAQLTIHKGCFARQSPTNPGRWQVTGLGSDVAAAEMLAWAAAQGIHSRFSREMEPTA